MPAAKKESTALAPISGAGTAMALPDAWRAKLNAQAKDVAAKERPSVSKISLRAGQLTYGGNPVKGNMLPVIILAAGHRNTFYDTLFDPNNLQNPVCFSLSLEGEDMVAHENVPDENVPGDSDKTPRETPRSCKGCAYNEWGSEFLRAGSRGKACKETRRLVLLPADAAESAEDCKKAEMAIVDLPVTSAKEYSNFVNGLAAQAGIPPWAAVTEFTTRPDAKTQFKCVFTPTSVVQDEEVLAVLEQRLEEAQRLCLLPYDEVSSTKDGKMSEGAGVAEKADPKVTAAATKRAKKY